MPRKRRAIQLKGDIKMGILNVTMTHKKSTLKTEVYVAKGQYITTLYILKEAFGGPPPLNIQLEIKEVK